MYVDYMKAITERYSRLGYPPYDWFHADTPPPWQPFGKKLSDCKVGMMSTSGAYVAGQVAYFYKDDTSTRRIPKSTPTGDLRFSHITENYLVDPRRDPNCIFPIDALRRLEEDGTVGAVADDLFSCMGGIYSKRRVAEELAPAVHENFKAQNVDAALLVAM